MKKLILHLFLVLFFFISCTKNETSVVDDEKVKILDKKFEQELLDLKIDSDKTLNGLASKSDLEKVKAIRIYGDIEDITGIEYFVNLDSLTFEIIGKQNNLKSLNLSKNINLSYLNISYNFNLTSLNLLNNINLKELSIWSMSSLANLNILNCKNLKIINCSGSGLTELNVRNCLLLTDLNCVGTSISQLDLSKNLNLNRLLCYSNRVKEICVANLSQPTSNWNICGGIGCKSEIIYKVCQ
ncbi:hypothetical protein LV89_04040 [Arcicella aurantiaca]|uniref:Leucine rich repeat (LRR) protein n=1 Tax=Arcicella aurantiaca TaxID=591202 RepID=A0A316DLX6_9BACT|nr:hypothetical protein [Arcicella aurantiaca]PWK18905.1 hypothetical protein LV89_04040 [Arcicella aurantiaca]